MSPAVRLELLRVGACRHPECMARRGGRLSSVEFPSLSGLIHHPSRGWILYDTGYSSHFFDATSKLPERLYRTLVPPKLPLTETLIYQLAERGIEPNDIATIVVSHFHGDHVAGLRDFPRARIQALRVGRDHLSGLTGRRWRATIGGYLPALLPADFEERFDAVDDCALLPLPTWLGHFNTGFDLLGDGSLIGVPLPGHAFGQLGMFLPNVEGGPAFLIADAAWSSRALRDNRPPPSLTLRLTSAANDYHSTFSALTRICRDTPQIALLPSHCAEALGRYGTLPIDERETERVN